MIEYGLLKDGEPFLFSVTDILLVIYIDIVFCDVTHCAILKMRKMYGYCCTHQSMSKQCESKKTDLFSHSRIYSYREMSI